MPPPTSYAISSGLLKSFIENSIQNILESEMERLKREERELLAILEADFIGLIRDSSDDEMNPSTYQYIFMLSIYAPYLMIQRRLSQIAPRWVGEVIDDGGPSESEEEEESKAKEEVWDLLG